MAKEPMLPVNLRLPRLLLEALDRACAEQGSDRSALIRVAIEEHLGARPDDKLTELERRIKALETASGATGRR